MNRFAHWGLAWVVAVPFAFAQSSAALVEIQHVSLELPTVHAYVSVTDSNGTPIVGVKGGDLSALLGGTALPVSTLAEFGSSHEGVATMLLIDISASISRRRFQDMMAAASFWIERMEPKDLMAVIAVGRQASLVQDFTGAKIELIQAVKSLKVREERTALYAAIVKSLKLLQSRTDLPARRVTIMMSDGKDDDSETGITENDLYGVMDQTRLPVFAIGVPVDLTRPTGDKGLKILAGLALRSGGAYQAFGGVAGTTEAEQIRNAVRSIYVAGIVCDKCPASNASSLVVAYRGHQSRPYPLVIWPPPPPATAPWYQQNVWLWVVAGGLLLAGIAITLAIVLRRRRFPGPVNVEPDVPVEPDYAPPPPDSGRVSLVSPRPRRPNPTLHVSFVVVGRGAHRYEADLGDLLVIGSSPECNVCLNGDDSVSPRHIEVFLHGGSVHARAVEGSGLVLLQGVALRAARRIEHRDVLVAGNTQLRILIGDQR